MNIGSLVHSAKGGEIMAINHTQFTITITPSLKADIDLAKRKNYNRRTQNEMFCDLIDRGLASIQSETSEHTQCMLDARK